MQRRRLGGLEENAAAASIDISADTQAGLLRCSRRARPAVLRYPENHLVRLGI